MQSFYRVFRLTPCIVAILVLLATAPISVHAQASSITNGIVQEIGSITFPGAPVTDVWGWTDPATNSEYAIVGWHGSQGSTQGGFFVVNVDNPAQPVLTGTANVQNGFDVKMWKNYVYSVNGGTGTASITDISNPVAPALAGTFPSSHNIWIDEKGFLFAEAPGLHIYDLNSDPTNPELVWTGGSSGHDCIVFGDTLYSFHGSYTRIYDITDRTNPVELSTIRDPSITYHHSGTITEDGNYLIINDELAEHPSADITIWDITDITRPQKVAAVAYSSATVHNVMIRGDLAYFSFYNDGFRVLDMSDPHYPTWLGESDINGDSGVGEGYTGAFGVYSLTKSGLIYISGTSMEGGLLKLFSASKPIVNNELQGPTSFDLLETEAWPNPFRSSVTLEFNATEPSESVVSIFDILGRNVRSLEITNLSATRKQSVWNGLDDGGKRVPAGVYFVQIVSRASVSTTTVFLVD